MSEVPVITEFYRGDGFFEIDTCLYFDNAIRLEFIWNRSK